MKLLKEKYNKEVLPALKKKFGLKSDLAAPKITKVVVNIGFNPVSGGAKIQEELTKDLTIITGQKPTPCQVKKPEATFKTRKGMVNGLKITLRGSRMFDFLNRLIHLSLPRGRDFRGLPESGIDQGGNLNIGIKEHIIFPDVAAEHTRRIFGFQITTVIANGNKEKGKELFKLLGFPIKFKENKNG